MKSLIYKSTGSWYVTKTPDGHEFKARIKGVFKIGNITSTNPIAVGDWVEVEMENELEDGVMINKIYDRANYIVRTSPHNKNQQHIIASNLDQSLLFATLKDPKTSNGFVDRFLIACEMSHIPAIIVINKADIYEEKELEKFEEWKEMYETAGYKILLCSFINGDGIAELKETLKAKTTLLSGHSGVGKSTFINNIFPELDLKTQDVSDWSGKGQHTTTFAEMFDLPFGGKIIDTPGVKEFGIIGIEKEELSHYFPEMRDRINECKFNNCMHINEPGCAVKEAVNEGDIPVDRYASYLSILDSMDSNNNYRT